MSKLQTAMAGICRLEQLAEGHTVIHRLHPLAKLLSTLVYLVAVISFPGTQLTGLVGMLAYPIVLMALSETPWRPLLGRLAVALPFALAGGIGNLLVSRTPALMVGTLVVTEGMLSCCSILLKTLCTVLAVLLLIATTSFSDLNDQLLRLHVPKLLCLQLLMTYRYLSVLFGEAGRMYTAYTLRAPGRKALQLADMGNFLGQLILRSFDRAERIYTAMRCRGFDGSYHSRPIPPPGWRDWCYAIGISALALLLRFFDLAAFLGGFL